MHLTSKHSIHRVWPGKASNGERRDSVMTHVEGSILTIVISAADVVASGPDPDSEQNPTARREFELGVVSEVRAAHRGNRI